MYMGETQTDRQTGLADQGIPTSTGPAMPRLLR